jgi:hypothetical protein
MQRAQVMWYAILQLKVAATKKGACCMYTFFLAGNRHTTHPERGQFRLEYIKCEVSSV